MKEYSWKWAFFIAFSVAALWYLHNDIFVDFADEGFLWYGVQQLLKGQVPLRDFQAYDPGRYYWCAGVFSLLGQGLMNLRLAAGLFQFTALSFGLLALRRVSAHPLFLLVSGLLSAGFMLIPCRYFDSGMALVAVFFAVRLVERPSGPRHLQAGVFTGLAFFFGLNHGLYALAAFSALSLYLRFKGCVPSAARALPFFLSGLGIGLAPLVAMFLAIPGFWGSYGERLAVMASNYRGGKINVSYPIVWPWSVSWDQVSLRLPTLWARVLEFSNRFSTGVLFVFVIIYYLVSILLLARLAKIQQRPRALFVASVFVGYFYVGHIFSRCDINYLGEGVFPVWAGLLALWAFSRPAALKRTVLGLVVLFAAAGFLSAGLLNTVTFKSLVPKGGMTWYPVGKDRIWVLHSDAEYMDSVKALVSRYVKPEEPVLLAPLLTTFYCLLGKESPVHELYFVIALSRAMQERTVRQLEEKKVRWAIVADLSVDNHLEQALSHSHPLLWKYLMDHFEVVTNRGLRPGYCLMRRKL